MCATFRALNFFERFCVFCRSLITRVARLGKTIKRIANFMMDHPTDAKSSSETCVAGVRSAEVWR